MLKPLEDFANSEHIQSKQLRSFFAHRTAFLAVHCSRLRLSLLRRPRPPREA